MRFQTPCRKTTFLAFLYIAILMNLMSFDTKKLFRPNIAGHVPSSPALFHQEPTCADILSSLRLVVCLQSELCSICLEHLGDGRSCHSLINCRHQFHAECIFKFFTTGSQACPNCRTLVSGAEVYSVPLLQASELILRPNSDVVEVWRQGIVRRFRLDAEVAAATEIAVSALASTSVWRNLSNVSRFRRTEVMRGYKNLRDRLCFQGHLSRSSTP